MVSHSYKLYKNEIPVPMKMGDRYPIFIDVNYELT